MDRSSPKGGGYGRAALATSGAEQYFVAPKDSEEMDGGHLRDFLPAGLRTSAKQAPTHLLFPSSFGSGPTSASTAAMDGVPGREEYGSHAGAGPSTATAATTMSIMSPIFHFTSHDTTIVAMEHNNHCKLLALSTSKSEVFVTLTQLMPVVEDAVAVIEQKGPTIDERLQDWDPAAMTMLVDRLPFPCTQLRWAPWQHGVYLAGICPGKEVRLYRYSHGRWALDAALTEPADCLAFAFSAQFTLACACRRGRMLLLTRRAAPGEERAWSVCHRHTPSAAGGAGTGGEGGRQPTPQRSSRGAITAAAAAAGGDGGKRQEATAASGASFGDCVAVDFDESGSLLAVVDQNAGVRVYAVSHEGTKISHVAFARERASGKRYGRGGSRQVAWSPSAGRSFLILAVVFSNRIHLWFLRRPRHLNAAGMPLNAGAAGGPRGGGGGGQQPLQLQLLAESTALCEEVAKLSWNTTGTRFVTSHSDSSVHVWVLDVTYQQAQPAPLAVLLQGGGSGLGPHGMPATSAAAGGKGGDGSDAGCGGTGAGGRPDQKLNLVVAIRKVSSVYPYHALNAK